MYEIVGWIVVVINTMFTLFLERQWRKTCEKEEQAAIMMLKYQVALDDLKKFMEQNKK